MTLPYSGVVPTKEAKWGKWIWRRAVHTGFRRQEDFARTVGCSRQQLVNWLAMEYPPTQMRKGFDRKLAFALRTTARTLFTDWEHVAPESAEQLTLYADRSLIPIHDLQVVDDKELRQALLLALDQLDPYEQENLLLQIAVGVLKKKKDARSAFFRDIVDRFGVMRRFIRTIKHEL